VTNWKTNLQAGMQSGGVSATSQNAKSGFVHSRDSMGHQRHLRSYTTSLGRALQSLFISTNALRGRSDRNARVCLRRAQLLRCLTGAAVTARKWAEVHRIQIKSQRLGQQAIASFTRCAVIDFSNLFAHLAHGYHLF
jgi:hypothetical protein